MSHLSRRLFASINLFFLMAAFLMPLSFSITPTQSSYSFQTNTHIVQAQESGSAFDAINNSAIGCGFSVAFDWTRIITTCVPMIYLYLTSKALEYGAIIFDNLLYFSIESSYLRIDVLDTIWGNIRDIANVTFILVLIYLSFYLIVVPNAFSTASRLIVRLILIALILNFSLFISKVVIDAGNITAYTFYNSISAPPVKDDWDLIGNLIETSEDKKHVTVSGAIVQIFNPARLVGAETFKTFTDKLHSDDEETQIMLIILTFATLNIMMAIEFAKAGLFFLSRIIWLMVLMIVSPLAFVSSLIPGKSKLKEWFGLLLQRSFCIVPYVFALWALILITSAPDVAKTIGSKETTDVIVMGVLVKFILIYAVLKLARTKTESMCDDGTLGKAIGGGAGKFAAGLTIGAVTGGAGFVARSSVGRIASNAYRGREGKIGGGIGERLAKAEQEGRFGASVVRRGLRNLSNKQFGTGESFEKRRDSEADSRFAEANMIENINTRRMTREFEDEGMDAEAARRKAITESRLRTNQSLRSKTGKVGPNGEPKGGIFARMTDWTAAGGTDASAEALQRRLDSEQKDADKKSAQEKIVADRIDRENLAEMQNQSNTRAAAAAVASAGAAMAGGNGVGADQTFLDNLEKSYRRQAGKDEDGNPVFELTGTDEKQFNDIKNNLNSEVQSITQAAAAEQTLLKDSIEELTTLSQEDERKIQAQQSRLEEQNEIAQETTKQMEALQEIIEEMDRNNGQAELNDRRKEVLRNAGVAVADNATVTQPNMSLSVKDALVGKETELAGVRQVTNNITENITTTRAELESTMSTIQAEEARLQTSRESAEKNIAAAYESANKAAKSRLAARVKAQDSIDVAKADRIEEDSRAYQDSGRDVSTEDQDARLGDLL